MNATTHNHAACKDSAVKSAEALCHENGVRLTSIRRRVLELVWNGHKAVKAYDILKRLDETDGAQAPTTVYRALEFLQAQGLVHKVESLNAFVGCAHPAASMSEDGHDCQLFICDACGDVAECCDDTVSGKIRENARLAGFRPKRQMLEVHGTCAGCGAL